MLRYYQTINNLGGDITPDLMFDQPVSMISPPSAQFDIQTGYTNNTSKDGALVVTLNEMVFNGGPPVTPTVIGLYILFDSTGFQQIVVNVTDVTTVTSTSLFFDLPIIVNDFFDPISSQLAIDGGDRYRCYSIKNDDPTLTFTGGKLWIASQVAEGSIEIGLDPSGVSGTPTISDGTTPPVGVVFSAPLDEVSGLSFPGNLLPGDYIFVWVKRTNIPNTTSDTYRFNIEESGSYV